MSGATRIIAVRHGETDWNVATRIQGQIDIGLNDKGRWQAERVAEALADEALDAIYSSDLSRAHATAQAIAAAQPALHAPVQTHTGLRERGFGKFEGHTYAAIEAQWPDESRLWKIRDPHFAPLGGESPVQVMARVGHTVNDIAARHPGEQIVLVAHGGVLDMLYRLATQQSVSAARTWELGNTAINRLLWTPEALTLVGWADTRHLDGEERDEFGA
ncbi:histidine phosphatase family protein [Rhodoferax lacus]|uniref:Histidine phosphatase family protein n=1 Tax=Rhodoferax lacus TaxID=2184758 RepID=A0A3E1RDM3_9BURK|nr:histidine phosphatase family protein [Rhodoferax lacus]RFO97467.1 histidine phosphatase family protein [Rhodoferax lacus]